MTTSIAHRAKLHEKAIDKALRMLGYTFETEEEKQLFFKANFSMHQYEGVPNEYVYTQNDLMKRGFTIKITSRDI